jgi:phosphate transport system permease protein
MLPVLVLAVLLLILVRESLPAIRQLGLAHLFSTQYSGHFSTGKGLYGLVPSLWGTFLATMIGVAVALPVALSLALLTTEFTLGPLGRAANLIVGVLAGIPPIVYALMGLVLVRALIEPKLAAPGLDPSVAMALPGLPAWNAGTLPNSVPNSTLLAGLLLGMLVIPLMTPLIADAIRAVPNARREASWALGATRGYTLQRVVLPGALPGIVGALAMGMLTCAGEVIIVTFMVGYEGKLPSPLWDVFERVPVLTATGAGLQGGIGATAEGLTAIDYSVGYFTGLLLLLFAAAALALTGWLQRALGREGAR